MKKVAGRLRLDLAQYRELEAFSQFGSELDPQTQRTLARGERMVATLNQPQYQPWPMEEQVVAIFAGINGYLDGVRRRDVPRFQDELREHLRSEGSLYGEIREQKDLPDDLADKLRAELDKFEESSAAARPRGRWRPSRTSSAASPRSRTRARSRRRWSSSPRRSCAGPRHASRRSARTPSGCRS